ncbi:hypothetical protein ABZ354_25050 [Streptomyces sp. NPDC005925]|uniref:hypothetical protein n=1 Tax=Streptomyces sp. NPDC005925 TaxID=3157172 RepID=UPI0033E76B4D
MQTTRTRRSTRAALAVLAAGAALALAAVPSTAADGTSATDTPRFLEPAELPPHATSLWYGSDVTAGQPEVPPLCVGDALPSISSHRLFWTDLDTTAVQVTVVEPDEQRAAAFAALLRKKLADCAQTLMEQYPDITATQKYYGKQLVEEGAEVFGVHTVGGWGASDINLLSVGRDGRTVTVVRWGQMGDFEQAQVGDFWATTVRAVNKLY